MLIVVSFRGGAVEKTWSIFIGEPFFLDRVNEFRNIWRAKELQIDLSLPWCFSVKIITSICTISIL